MTRDRNSKNRQRTLARKAHQYSRKFNANTAIIVQDQGQFYLYTSSSKFLPEIVKSLNVPVENTFDPDAFDTIQDMKKRTSRSPSPSSSLNSEQSFASTSNSSVTTGSSPRSPYAIPPTAVSPSYFPCTPYTFESQGQQPPSRVS
ncbi:hypothetical protein F4802DRAFT_591216 [Xylaria palmicola]|nr:hypothetical protein F4802DRAFT_591216 [Xylaria palmicola]